MKYFFNYFWLLGLDISITMSYFAFMNRKTFTIDLPTDLRQHLENQATKAGFPNLGSFVKMLLRKASKFKGK